MSDVFHPAALILIAIVAVGALQVLGAFLARKHFRRLNEIYDHVKADPRSNEGDRTWVRAAMDDAVDRSPIWVMALAAPIVAVVLPVAAIVELLKRPTPATLERDIDELYRATAAVDDQPDPATGAFWMDPIRAEAQSHGYAASWKQSPLPVLWLALWLLPGFLASLVIGGALTVVVDQYRLLTEQLSRRLGSAFSHRI